MVHRQIILLLHFDEAKNIMIRVAITEDHPQVRAALRLLLSLSKDVELIAETDNGHDAVNCVKNLQPDVLVMAINLPEMDGFETTKQINNLSVPTRVILISVDDESFISMQAAEVGARGFVPKDNAAKQLLPAIKAVQRGDTYFLE
jgi:DNA-binding NarL/FixJ family response regulator